MSHGSNREQRLSHNGAEQGGNGGYRIHGIHLLYLTLGALGVVYGDIGTSPLYAFRESFHPQHGIPATPANVLGILSLIFWALILVISVKYVIFVMRADNRGEGGILALTALIQPGRGLVLTRRRAALIALGLFGTALLYGDGMITPSISVLSAVEGLEIATPLFKPFIIPITIGVLIALFLFQSRGTERVGRVFGPATLVWFVLLGVLGVRWIIRQPGVVQAINPLLGIDFFIRNGWNGFLVLGSVFLAVTGGEALYADMGHFGKPPIRLAWFALVQPALLLNYFGQGALLMEDPAAVVNPFYHMAPDWALYPTVLIATVATVIASQALITGAFSLTRQAVQLGYLSRMEIKHTSVEEIGQIYISTINWVLMAACIGLVVAFRSSSNMAAAYGVAVTTTMVITTVLMAVLAHERWKWSLPAIIAFTAPFLMIDMGFWIANLVKIPAGGWFPLVIGAIIFTLMTTWKRGREILGTRMREGTMGLELFIRQVRTQKIARVPGAAVFMYSDPKGAPPALLHNLEHNHVVHEQVIVLSVVTSETPRVLRKERIEIEELDSGFWRATLHYGFMQDPHVPRDLALARNFGLEIDTWKVSYFLGRERILPTKGEGMAEWREHIFAIMSRNSRNATDFFRLPPNRVVELGAQVEI